MSKINVSAEMVARNVFSKVAPRFEKMLEKGTPITRPMIESAVRNSALLDERMVQYVSDSLANTYIG